MDLKELLLVPFSVAQHTQEASTAERLKAAIESHVTHEGAFLDLYAEAGKTAKSPLVKFVLELVLADEKSHHAILGRVLSRLDADLFWRKNADIDMLPDLGEVDEAEQDRLFRLTAKFIREERQAIANCKALIEICGGLYSGLLTMILQMMIHDSEKHLTMLEFVSSRLLDARLGE